MTQLFVLGLLSTKPMSGYDIQQNLSECNVSIWADLVVGSIYHALKKLEQKDYISVSSIESTGHRQRAIYQITDKGRDYLSELMNASIAASSVVYPKTLYSGLAFIDILSKEETVSSLKLQKNCLKRSICRPKRLLQRKIKLWG